MISATLRVAAGEVTRVGGHRDRWAGVPQAASDDLSRHARAEQVSRVGVAAVMQAALRDTRQPRGASRTSLWHVGIFSASRVVGTRQFASTLRPSHSNGYEAPSISLRTQGDTSKSMIALRAVTSV